MRRRHLLVLASAAALSAQAQVANLNDAINKAGRQRMLSQRMSKAWFALLQGTHTASAKTVLDRSMGLFDRQLVELMAFAPTPAVRETYQGLHASWREYKLLLVGATPERDKASALIKADAKMLALAHQGTQQYEALSGRTEGKLVNLAGRQRMLTQRMAKFYFAATLPVDADLATAEIAKARGEFVTAMGLLRNAPQANARIQQELALAEGQWVFFNHAIERLEGAGTTPKLLSDVFVTSENLLSVMDQVTGLYAAIT
ncbi:MAG TPA: type IV pili methyl-accepting chemotaxis transducer N-terminal domain-containing protein [Hydrogenophaga sp.]